MSYAAGDNPTAVAFADFNGDGIPDVAVANGSGTAVLLGMGAGVLAPTLDLASGEGLDVTAGDVNRDGHIDIVTLATEVSNASVVSRLYVHLGAGDGTFAAAVEYPLDGAADIELADVDEDGDPDVVAASRASNAAAVSLNTGDGTFAAVVTYAAMDNPDFIRALDLDRDDHVDLVIGSRRGGTTMNTLRGIGDGTFEAKVDVTLPAATHAIALGDLDGDSGVDVVGASYSAGATTASLYAMFGNRDGTFRVGPDAVTASGLPQVITDLDNDDKGDLLALEVGGQDTIKLGVQLGNGDGTFQTSLGFDTPARPTGVAVMQLDGTGRPDIVTIEPVASKISVLLGACSYRSSD